MPNITVLLRQEITRLARKEIRGIVEPLRKQAASLRHDVAALKRDKVVLERMVAGLVKSQQSGASSNAATNDAPINRERITSSGIKALRSRLGLSAEKVGLLVGASGQSVYGWEGGVKPRKAQMAKLIELRGMGKKQVNALLESKVVAPRGRKPGKRSS